MKALKEKLVEIARRSYEEKLFAGTSGNLSVYDKRSGLVAITPTSVDYRTMKPEDVVLLKPDGSIAEGFRKPSSEWRMHTCIYEHRPDVLSVVHTHSPYATSFAVLRQEIPAILIEMLLFLGGSVPVADFALPGTEQVGKEALKVLSDRTVCLMANHGALAIGETLEQAYIRAVYLEDAAKIYSLAKTCGEIQRISPDDILEMRNRMETGEKE